MTSATEVILVYVCPIVGVILSNFVYTAPLKDLQNAVYEGKGLNDLNPTPWAFMVGNCLGWTVYGVLAKDWYIFWSVYPGFIISVWLNLGAIKLLYSSHHRKQTQAHLIEFLAKNEQSRRSLIKKTIELEAWQRTLIDKLLERCPSNADDNRQEGNDDDDDDDGVDVSFVFCKNEDGKSKTQQIESDIELSTQQEPSVNDQRISEITFVLPLVASHETNGNKRVSSVSFALPPLENDNKNTSFQSKRSSQKSLDDINKEIRADEKVVVPSNDESRRSFWLRKRFSSVSDYWGTMNRKSVTLKKWGEVVWEVTSQTSLAKVPHEHLVVGMVLFWSLVLSGIGFYNQYASGEENNTSEISRLLVGYIVNINKTFFYGAPLSRITSVIKTKNSDSLHFPTMLTNTLCNTLWFAYGIAPQINDPFIYATCVLGLLFGAIQFFLFMVFPKHGGEVNKQGRVSISALVPANIMENLFPESNSKSFFFTTRSEDANGTATRNSDVAQLATNPNFTSGSTAIKLTEKEEVNDSSEADKQ